MRYSIYLAIVQPVFAHGELLGMYQVDTEWLAMSHCQTISGTPYTGTFTSVRLYTAGQLTRISNFRA